MDPAIVQSYRKRPVVIQAIQLGEDNFEALGEFVGDKAIPAMLPDGLTGLLIHTLEGDHLASPGDFIIKGVADEFYPVKEAIFKETYDWVEEALLDEIEEPADEDPR